MSTLGQSAIFNLQFTGIYLDYGCTFSLGMTDGGNGFRAVRYRNVAVPGQVSIDELLPMLASLLDWFGRQDAPRE